MTSNRKTGIIVAVLFLIATVTFGTGSAMIDSILDDTEYLNNVTENENQIIIASILAFIDGVAILLIAILLYPLLKKDNESIALGYVSFRIAEFSIILVYLLSQLLLIDLSQEFVKAGNSDESQFQTLGILLIAVRYWTLQMIYIFNGIAGLMLVYLLYKTKLIPQFISVIGFIGYVLIIPGALLDMFGYIDVNNGVGLIVFLLPGGLFELILPIWLIVKGFNSSSINSIATETDN